MENNQSLVDELKSWLSQLRTPEDPIQKEIYASWRKWFDDLNLSTPKSGLAAVGGLLKYAQDLEHIRDWFQQGSPPKTEDELRQIKARLDALEAILKTQSTSDVREPSPKDGDSERTEN